MKFFMYNKRVLLVAAPLVASLVILGCSMWISYDALSDAKGALDEIHEIDELRSSIIYLDEVLTMSAIVNSSTEEQKWEERYRKHDPILEKKINRAIELVSNTPKIKQEMVELNEVNSKLVELEYKSFDFKKTNQQKNAYQLLTSPTYIELKYAYKDKVEALVKELVNIEDKAQKTIEKSILVTILAALIGGGITLSSWLIVLNILNKWQILLEQKTGELETLNRTLDEKIFEQTEELQKANQKLKESNFDLENFAAIASHDLQEPLRKIVTFGERLQGECQDQLDEDGTYYLERIVSASHRMRNLINDLLVYSRVTRKGEAETAVNLNTLVHDILSDFELKINEKSASVEVSDLETIEADASQMRQLFQNLISNALKFQTPHNKPVIKISGAPNSLKPGLYTITVSDNGIGLDEKYKEKIFTIFQRLHGRQEYEGSGIGLAICRRIVNRHNGNIEVSSIPGEGTTFTINLPIKQKQLLTSLITVPSTETEKEIPNALTA